MIGRKRIDEHCKSKNPSWYDPAVTQNENYKIFESEEEFEIKKIIIHPGYQERLKTVFLYVIVIYVKAF